VESHWKGGEGFEVRKEKGLGHAPAGLPGRASLVCARRGRRKRKERSFHGQRSRGLSRMNVRAERKGTLAAAVSIHLEGGNQRSTLRGGLGWAKGQGNERETGGRSGGGGNVDAGG